MPTTFQTIICPLDGSDVAERALEPLAALAQAVNGRLVLVRSVQLYGMDIGWYTHAGSEAMPYEMAPAIPIEDLLLAARDAAKRYLDEIAARLTAQGVAKVETVLSDAHPAEAILETAAGATAGLIVMATHGAGGVERWVLGSVTEKIVQSSPVPVLLVRGRKEDLPQSIPPRAWPAKHILVTLDGSKTAEAVLEPAAALARAFGAHITLAHVVVEPEGLGWTANLEEIKGAYSQRMVAYLTTQAEQLIAQGIPTETYLQSGSDAADQILDLDRTLNIDLIALSTHGYGGWRRLALGSVADRVLRASNLPVLLVRCEEGSES